MDDYAKKLLDLFSPDTRSGLQFLTGAWLLALSLLFLAAFIFQLSFVQAAAAQLGLPAWVYGSLLVLTVHAAVVLLGGDVLVHGNPERNKFVAAFRRSWPSDHLASSLGINADRARAVWFCQLDKWEAADSPRHAVIERTTRLGYACRFVYHVQTMARWLFLAGAAWLLVDLIRFRILGIDVAGAQAKIATTCLFGLLWAGVRATNRIGDGATVGVWARERAINQNHCRWIDSNVDSLREELEGTSSGTQED